MDEATQAVQDAGLGAVQEAAPANYGSFSEVLDSVVVESPLITNSDMFTTGDQFTEQNQASTEQQTETAPVAQESPKYSIKHNGQEVELTLDDLIANAQKGYDYTKKTSALADERRSFGEQVQQFEGINSVLNDPRNGDLLDMIQARMRGESPVQYQQKTQQHGNQATDPLAALRLDPEIYEPQLVEAVNTLIDNYKGISSEVQQYKINETRKSVLDAGSAYEQEFKQEFGRDMNQNEIDSIVGFMQERGLGMADVNNFRMAGNYLFEQQKVAARVQKEIERIKAEHSNGVISRTPTSGVKPVPNSANQPPKFKNHDEANRYIAKQLGIG